MPIPLVENDARIGHIMDKLRALGLDKGNTLVFWTTDNGAWQDVYPDAGYTPFRGTKGTDREGGNRVPAIAWMPGKIKAGEQEPRHRRRTGFHGHLLRAGWHQAAGKGSRRSADDLRQLRHVARPLRHRQVRRAKPGITSPRMSCCPARSAGTTTSSCSTCAAMTARRPVVWRWTATSVGRVPRSISPPFRKSSTSGRTRRNATTCS